MFLHCTGPVSYTHLPRIQYVAVQQPSFETLLDHLLYMYSYPQKYYNEMYLRKMCIRDRLQAADVSFPDAVRKVAVINNMPVLKKMCIRDRGTSQGINSTYINSVFLLNVYPN